MKISSLQLRCPITALGILAGADVEELLLVGEGPLLRVYSLAREEVESPLCSYQVFEVEKIHGFRLIWIEKKIHVLVFGVYDVSILIISQDSMTGEVTCGASLRLESVPMDMVLDACTIGEILVLGHSQNFLSLYSLKTGRYFRQLRSTVVCVLFSMRFSTGSQDQNVAVASGTAFGEINIWDISEGVVTVNQSPVAITPRLTLRGHEGVVSKLCFSEDSTQLASVSDDRTVRLWDTRTGTLLFTGWGHVCRVWDVIFVADRSGLLVTAGEDLTVKIWDPSKGICRGTFEGHIGRNVWCIAYSPAHRCLISGGNDSSIKIWAINDQNVLSPEATSRENIDSYLSGSSTEASSLLRGENPSSVKLSPDGKDLYLVTQNGRLLNIPLEHSVSSSRGNLFSGFGETRELDVECSCHIQTTDMKFFAESGLVFLFCGHVDGSATIAVFDRETHVMFGKHTWKAHRWRTIDLWILQASTSSLSGITATIAGEVKVWSLELDLTSEFSVREVICLAELAVVRKQIAACGAQIALNSSGPQTTGFLIGGCKGAICLYPNSARSAETGDEPQQPSCYMTHIHGLERVSFIMEIYGGFVSCGHDGSICLYNFTADGFSRRTNLYSGSMNCPEQLIVHPSLKVTHRSWASIFKPVFVSGFQGNVFRVYDIKGKYELMKIEAGGWKRLHDCVINHSIDRDYPEVMSFVSLDKTGEAPILYIHSIRNAEKSVGRLECIEGAACKEEKGVGTSTKLPLYIGQSSNGRVTYCSTFLGSNSRLLAAGGEEGTVKIFETASMKILQEVSLPSECPVRAMCSCPLGYDKNKGILVAGGGKLSFAIWHFDDALATPSIEVNVPSLCPFLRLACVGNPPKNATQEHRILSSTCWYTEEDSSTIFENGYFILLCDSRGCARLFYLPSSTCRLSLVWEKEISEYPILSCSRFQYFIAEKKESLILCFGDTTGNVFAGSIQYCR